MLLVTAGRGYASDQPKTVADYEKLVINYRFSIPDSGIFYAKKGLELSRLLHDKKGEAIMLNHLGIIDENQGRFSAARHKYLKAIQLYTQLSDKAGIADETIRLGVTEMRQGNFDAATSYFFKALRMHDAIKNTRGIMECNITLGEAYMGQTEYDIALTYLKNAETLSRKLPLMGLTLYIYNNLGLLYTETGEINKAITYYEKGIALSNQPQYAGLNVTLLNGLGMAYARAGDTKRAAAIQLTSLERARRIKNYLREIQTLNGLADTYSKQDPDRALAYLEQAVTLAYQKHASKVAIETLRLMTALYEQQGKYAEALQVNKRERALSDSIFNLASSTEIGNLKASYDLQQSQTSVERLKYLNSEQRSQQKVIVFIVIAMVTILVIVMIFYARIRAYNRRLQQLNADLLASNESKDKLFSVLGHDLRAPLATVKNFLSLLDDDDLTAIERNQVVSELQHNCDASLDVLNKLLRWGQLQLKGKQVNPVNFNPADIVAQNVRLFRNAAAEKHIIINIKVDQKVMINGDADHFDFIVRNLLSNAIKFTATGGYVMVGSLVTQPTDNLSFYIKDNGVGMPPEQAEQIFRRINTSQRGTHGEKGTGLGLMLSYEFIQANNGAIEVSSAPGKGTTFTFTFGEWVK
ncbi:tetratricopeptide repeat-containing sensor histidine kinase [Mucilaginibacter sp. UR6-1]|uniref:tetratricopeptide repeat-containing sensor histidine kinase n=1 Tax=Mucilaginibacter sp. UR6-1 TaxID=1435643 RepID=UPI001E555585|nr:tetratricopeptide repeat protein [Mucilaginibacter sp. UR6-1]MCC8409289.1 tetratricopeptide repeat-containing sensor histidine kinase [Mucilaginibacter sp. UR6-1]